MLFLSWFTFFIWTTSMSTFRMASPPSFRSQFKSYQPLPLLHLNSNSKPKPTHSPWALNPNQISINPNPKLEPYLSPPITITQIPISMLLPKSNVFWDFDVRMGWKIYLVSNNQIRADLALQIHTDSKFQHLIANENSLSYYVLAFVSTSTFKQIHKNHGLEDSMGGFFWRSTVMWIRSTSLWNSSGHQILLQG